MVKFILVTDSEILNLVKEQGSYEELKCIEIQDLNYGHGVLVPEELFDELSLDPDWNNVFNI